MFLVLLFYKYSVVLFHWDQTKLDPNNQTNNTSQGNIFRGGGHLPRGGSPRKSENGDLPRGGLGVGHGLVFRRGLGFRPGLKPRNRLGAPPAGTSEPQGNPLVKSLGKPAAG